MPATVGKFTSIALPAQPTVSSKAFAVKNKCNLKNNAIFK